MRLFRPADAIETAECWQLALERTDGPTVLALTRQNLPAVRKAARGRRICCAEGAYELVAADGAAEVTLFATGSEVEIAVERGSSARAARCGTRRLGALLELFLAQGGRSAARLSAAPVSIAVEAAVRQGWDAVIGADGAFVGMSTFGASAPYKELYNHFGITPEKVVEAALTKLGRLKDAPP